jgi:hypothetical protein
MSKKSLRRNLFKGNPFDFLSRKDYSQPSKDSGLIPLSLLFPNEPMSQTPIDPPPIPHPPEIPPDQPPSTKKKRETNLIKIASPSHRSPEGGHNPVPPSPVNKSVSDFSPLAPPPPHPSSPRDTTQITIDGKRMDPGKIPLISNGPLPLPLPTVPKENVQAAKSMLPVLPPLVLPAVSTVSSSIVPPVVPTVIPPVSSLITPPVVFPNIPPVVLPLVTSSIAPPVVPPVIPFTNPSVTAQQPLSQNNQSLLSHTISPLPPSKSSPQYPSQSITSSSAKMISPLPKTEISYLPRTTTESIIPSRPEVPILGSSKYVLPSYNHDVSSPHLHRNETQPQHHSEQKLDMTDSVIYPASHIARVLTPKATPKDNLEVQEKDKLELQSKFEILRKSLREREVPPYRDDIPYSSNLEAYQRYVREIETISMATKLKAFLLGSFRVVEFFFVNVLGIDIAGFAQSQIDAFVEYDMILIELGEKWGPSSASSSYSPEVRLLFVFGLNIILFWIVKKISDKIGTDISSGAKTVIREMAHKTPSEGGGGGIGNILNMLSGAAKSFTGEASSNHAARKGPSYNGLG